MSKDDKPTKLEPRLRFPEFHDAGEWVEKPISKICHILNNRRVPVTTSDRIPGPYPYYGASGVVDFVNDYIFDERLVLVGEDGAKWEAFQPTAFIADGKYWVNNHAHVLKPHGIVDELLVAFLTLSDVGGFVTGAAPPKLTLGGLKKIPVPIPPAQAEQRKIAECLGSVDDWIAAETDALAALRRHKIGLMQQLFPRPGETRPRLRFPEFRNAGDWEERPLKSFAEYQNGKAYEKDITKDGRFIVVNSRFVSTDGVVRKYTNAEYCTAARGDVLMVLSDLPNGRALAKCFLVDQEERYAVNQRVARLTPESVVSPFLYYLLNRNPRLLVYDDGITQTHLSKGNVNDCLFPIPEEPDEQRRIAGCLASLDTNISAHSDKLTALRDHKCGLMQKLFPWTEGSQS